MAEDESCESRKFLPLVFLQTSRSLGGIRRKEEGREEGGRPGAAQGVLIFPANL